MKKVSLIIKLLSLIIIATAGWTFAAKPLPPPPDKLTIIYNSGKLVVNGHVFNKPVPLNKWVSALGPYSRADSDVQYYWDKLGLKLVRSYYDNGLITWLHIFFTHEGDDLYERMLAKKDYRRSPDTVFSGTLIVNGVKMTRNTKYQEYNKATKVDKMHVTYKSHLIGFERMMEDGIYEYSAEGLAFEDGTFREIGFYYENLPARKIYETNCGQKKSPAELKLEEEEKQKQEKLDKELERQKDEVREQEKVVENKRKAGKFRWFWEKYYNIKNRYDEFRMNNAKRLGKKPV
jgi:hypothetical protein